MLFNSHAFIFLFLPIAFALFFLFARISTLLAAGWLAVASLFFYGWWNPAYVALLLASIVGNYFAGFAIARTADAASKKRLLIAAICINLALLA